ncbi:hypothetical protein [Pseudomonas viridiflava]|uniref:hypothetical protein n=1 Tax=Pseudomonas viridiflava TaxID=33069 RepID=UPI000C077255|nr:hypothetical protein [Pseudomonas viridiflava]PHN57970.1 hypothetical protein AO275_00610 [Pseudomonas viridiflava]
MHEHWTFHDAVFAHWRGGIMVLGFAYKTADGIESGTGHHTRVANSWLERTTLHFEGTDGRCYRVISWKRADFSDALDAYDDVLAMARGEA